MTDSTPTDTRSAIALLRSSLAAEHDTWRSEIDLNALDIDVTRVRELPSGWWIPLGAGTQVPADYRGDEAFVVVTRDGSSQGLYRTGKPQWW